MPPREETERDRLRRIAILNARLPKKRTIAQGVLRNPAGEVLLCELSYKQEWDLPGGVVDPGESPATCLEREVREELAIDVTAGRLLAVNWLPPWRGWEDALLYLFDLGTHESGELDPSLFLRREIAGAALARRGRLRRPRRALHRTGCSRWPPAPSTPSTSRTASPSAGERGRRRFGDAPRRR